MIYLAGHEKHLFHLLNGFTTIYKTVGVLPQGKWNMGGREGVGIFSPPIYLMTLKNQEGKEK